MVLERFSTAHSRTDIDGLSVGVFADMAPDCPYGNMILPSSFLAWFTRRFVRDELDDTDFSDVLDGLVRVNRS